MAKVQINIEPSWTHQNHETVIEIEDAYLAGLDPTQRTQAIADIAEAAVNDLCPWGWSEVPG